VRAAGRRAAPILALALVCGCGRGDADRRAAPSVKAVVPAADSSFSPPPDGLLTPRQVELFLAVAQTLASRRQRTPAVPGTPGPRVADALEGVAPDVGAARSVFKSVEEYLWVKERVLEAEAATLAAKLNADEEAMLKSTLADLRSRLANAADEGSRKLLSEQIATFEAEAERTAREGREKEPDSVRANQKVLEPYRGRLSALPDELVRAGLGAGMQLPPPPPRKTP